MLNERMESAAKGLPSDKPNLNSAYALVGDMDSAVLAMEDSYRGANRDAAVAKLKEIREGLRRLGWVRITHGSSPQVGPSYSRSIA